MIAWITLALAGCWRSEQSWIERSGRSLGIVWIIAYVAARFAWLLWLKSLATIQIAEVSPLMRIPRLRFTVRGMMIAVAVMAIVLGLGIEVIRLKGFRNECLLKAARHKQIEAENRTLAEMSLELAASAERIISSAEADRRAMLGPPFRKPTRKEEENAKQQTERAEHYRNEAADQRTDAARFLEYAEYHAALKQKYSRAADRPWLFIEPDPLAPEPDVRGRYWLDQGEYRRALIAYEEGVQNRPENLRSLYALAWLLSTCPDQAFRDGKRAVELATRACTTTSRDPDYLNALAAAFAETGDFKAAVKTQREAIGRLSKGDASEKAYRARLGLYEANQPVRVTHKKAN